MRLSRYGYGVTVLGEMQPFLQCRNCGEIYSETFLKIPQQLPELIIKEQTDLYNATGYGRH